MAFDPNILNFGPTPVATETARTFDPLPNDPKGGYDPATVDPSIPALRNNPAFLDDVREFYRAKGTTFSDDQEMFDQFASDFSWADLNSASALFGTAGLTSALGGNASERERMKRLTAVWERVPAAWQSGGRGSDAVGDIVGALATDPLNLIGAGVAGKAGAAVYTRVAKAAIAQATRELGEHATPEAIRTASDAIIKRAVQSATGGQAKSAATWAGVKAGAASEAGVNAGANAIFDLITQARDSQLGLQDGIDLGQTAEQAGVGAALGGVLGAAGGAIAGRGAAHEAASALSRGLATGEHAVSAATPTPNLGEVVGAAVQRDASVAEDAAAARDYESYKQQVETGRAADQATKTHAASLTAVDSFNNEVAALRADPSVADQMKGADKDVQRLSDMVTGATPENYAASRKALEEKLAAATTLEEKGRIQRQMNTEDRVFRAISSIDPSDPTSAQSIIRALLRDELGIKVPDPNAEAAATPAPAPAAAPKAAAADTAAVAPKIETVSSGDLNVGDTIRWGQENELTAKVVGADATSVSLKSSDGKEFKLPTDVPDLERLLPSEAAAPAVEEPAPKKGRRGKKAAAATGEAAPAPEVQAAPPVVEAAPTPSEPPAAAMEGATEDATSSILRLPPSTPGNQAERARVIRDSAALSPDEFVEKATQELQDKGLPINEDFLRRMHAERVRMAESAQAATPERVANLSEPETRAYAEARDKIERAENNRQLVSAFSQLADLDAEAASTILSPILQRAKGNPGAKQMLTLAVADRYEIMGALVDKFREASDGDVNITRLKAFVSALMPNGMDEHDTRMLAAHIANLVEDEVLPMAPATARASAGEADFLLTNSLPISALAGSGVDIVDVLFRTVFPIATEVPQGQVRVAGAAPARRTAADFIKDVTSQPTMSEEDYVSWRRNQVLQRLGDGQSLPEGLDQQSRDLYRIWAEQGRRKAWLEARRMVGSEDSGAAPGRPDGTRKVFGPSNVDQAMVDRYASGTHVDEEALAAELFDIAWRRVRVTGTQTAEQAAALAEAEGARGERLARADAKALTDSEEQLVFSAYDHARDVIQRGGSIDDARADMRTVFEASALDDKGKQVKGSPDFRRMMTIANEMLDLRGDFAVVREGVGHVDTLAQLWDRGTQLERHEELRKRLAFLEGELAKNPSDETRRRLLQMQIEQTQYDLGVGDFANSRWGGGYVEKYQRSLSWLREGEESKPITVRLNLSAARSARRAMNRRILPALLDEADKLRPTSSERQSMAAAGMATRMPSPAQRSNARQAMRFMYGLNDSPEAKSALSTILTVVKPPKAALMQRTLNGSGDLLGEIARSFAKGDDTSIASARLLADRLLQDADEPGFIPVSKLLVQSMASASKRVIVDPQRGLSVAELVKMPFDIDADMRRQVRDLTGIDVISANDAWRAWNVLNLNTTFSPNGALSVDTRAALDRMVTAMEALATGLAKAPRRLPNDVRSEAVRVVRAIMRDHHPAEQAMAMDFLARVSGPVLPRIMARDDVPGASFRSLKDRIFARVFGAYTDADGERVWLPGARPAGQENQRSPLISGFGEDTAATRSLANTVMTNDGTYLPPYMRLYSAANGQTAEATAANRIVVDMRRGGVRTLIHETGHWGYFNILSLDEQLNFWRTLREEYYDASGNFMREKFAEQMHIDPATLKDAYKPAELFAYLFERWALEERTLNPAASASFVESVKAAFSDAFNKVARGIVAIYHRLRYGKLADIPPDLKTLFERIMPDEVSATSFREQFPDSHLREAADKSLALRGREISDIELAVSDLERELLAVTQAGGTDAIGATAPETRGLRSKLIELSSDLYKEQQKRAPDEARIAELSAEIDRLRSNSNDRDLMTSVILGQSLLNKYAMGKGTRIPNFLLNELAANMGRDIAEGDAAGEIGRALQEAFSREADEALDPTGTAQVSIDLDRLAPTINAATLILERLRDLRAYKVDAYRDAYNGRATGVAIGSTAYGADRMMRRSEGRFLRGQMIGADLLKSFSRNSPVRELVAAEMAAKPQADGLLANPPSPLVNALLSDQNFLRRSKDLDEAGKARARLAAYRILNMTGVLGDVSGYERPADLLAALPDSFGATVADKRRTLREMAKSLALGQDVKIEGVPKSTQHYLEAAAQANAVAPRAQREVQRRSTGVIYADLAQQEAAMQLNAMSQDGLDAASLFAGRTPVVKYVPDTEIAARETPYGTGVLIHDQPPKMADVAVTDLKAKDKALVGQLLSERKSAIGKMQAAYQALLDGKDVGETMMAEARARVHAAELALKTKYGVVPHDRVSMAFVRINKTFDLSRSVDPTELAALIEKISPKVAQEMITNNLASMPGKAAMDYLISAAVRQKKGGRGEALRQVLNTLKREGYDALRIDGNTTFVWDASNVASIRDPRFTSPASIEANVEPVADRATGTSAMPIVAMVNAKATAEDLVNATMSGMTPDVSATLTVAANLRDGKPVMDTMASGAARFWDGVRNTINLSAPATHLQRKGFSWLARMTGGASDFSAARQIGIYDEYWARLSHRMDGISGALNGHRAPDGSKIGGVPNRGGAIKDFFRGMKFMGDLPQSEADRRINEALRLAASGVSNAEVERVWSGIPAEQMAAERNAVRAIQAAFQQAVKDASERGVVMGNLGPNYFPQTLREDLLAKHRAGMIDFFATKFRRERKAANLPEEFWTDDAVRDAATRMVDNMIGGGGFWMPPLVDRRVPYSQHIDHHRVLHYSADEIKNAMIDGVPLRNFFVNHLETNLYNYFAGFERRLLWVEKFGPNGHMITDYVGAIDGGRAALSSLLTGNLMSWRHVATGMDFDGSARDIMIGRQAIAPVATSDVQAANMVRSLGDIWTRATANGDDVFRAAYDYLLHLNANPANTGWAKRAEAIAHAVEDFGGHIFGSDIGPTPQDRNYVAQFLKLASGGSLHDYNNRAHQSARILREFNSVTTLGASTLTSFNDTVMPLVRSGSFGSYLSAIQKLASDPYYRDLVRRTGVAAENIVHQRLANMHGSSSRLSNAFFYANGMTPWTTTMRQLAGAVAFESFRTWQQIVNAGDTGTRRYRNAVKSLQHFELDDMARTQSFDNPDVMLDQRMSAAIYRFAQESVFAPNNTEVPPWTKTPLGALVFQFKAFPLMYGRMAGFAIKEAKRWVVDGDGQIAPLLYLLGASVGVGMVANWVKDIAQSRGGPDGRSREARERLLSKTLQSWGFKDFTVSDPNWDKALGNYTEAFFMAGGLGILTDIAHSVAEMADNGDYGAWRIAGAIGGPWVGTVRDAITVGTGAIANGDSNAPARAAGRAVAGKLPIIGTDRNFRETIADAVGGPAGSGGGSRGFGGFGGFGGF